MVQSYIEILDITTKEREIFWSDTQLLEAPNWSADGFLLVNSEGLLYKIYVNNKRKEMVNTEFAVCCNNDHGISPDGTQIVISSHDAHNNSPLAWQTSKIYVLPISGGTPRIVTHKNASFWHGWSPDGKTLVYTALRNNQWDIYAILVEGGEEQQLTNSSVQDDGAEFDLNGEYIYYNSYVSGSMEIWRMKADGSQQTQLTNDVHSNWFPHVSPDNTTLVYLCYLQNQGELHPFGKQVKIRCMDIASGAISDLTDEFFGGQGTLNVNSWSPDGSKIAFVRYNENLK